MHALSEWHVCVNIAQTTHLANNEKILPLDHSILDHVLNTLSHLCLVLVDKRPIDVPVPGRDGCFHRVCNLARRRLIDIVGYLFWHTEYSYDSAALLKDVHIAEYHGNALAGDT